MTASSVREATRPFAFYAVVIAAALVATASALADQPGVQGQSRADGGALTQSQVLVESGCTACHSQGGGPPLAPGLDGVYARAGQRVLSEDYGGAATDAEGYLLESILDHCADRLPDWDCTDAPQYGNWISLDEAYRLVDAMARSR